MCNKISMKEYRIRLMLITLTNKLSILFMLMQIIKKYIYNCGNKLTKPNSMSAEDAGS